MPSRRTRAAPLGLPFIGSWALPKMGIVLGAGLLAAIINATIGAIILLLIIRLIQGRGRLRRR